MESELVAGYFTEHSSHLFVYFFLAEYSSILLYSTVTVLLFFGGYNFVHFLGVQNFLESFLVEVDNLLAGSLQINQFCLDLVLRFLGLRFLNGLIQFFAWLAMSTVLLSIAISLKVLLVALPYLPASILGLKSGLVASLFVLIRATLPRLRYDQLISLC